MYMHMCKWVMCVNFNHALFALTYSYFKSKRYLYASVFSSVVFYYRPKTTRLNRHLHNIRILHVIVKLLRKLFYMS